MLKLKTDSLRCLFEQAGESDKKLGSFYGKRFVDTPNTHRLVFTGLNIFVSAGAEQNLGARSFHHPFTYRILEGLPRWSHYAVVFVFCFHIYYANQRMVRIYE